MNKLFIESLDMRLETLERNIKSKSNSFYDAYLDLVEATAKYILDECGIEFGVNDTCGRIMKESKIASFFKDTLNLEDYLYNKIIDYIKKVNDHKHKKEKTPTVEGIVLYMRNYYEFINKYADYKNLPHYEFDANHYAAIYGETEREIASHKNEIISLKEELQDLSDKNKLSELDNQTFKSLLSFKELELLTLDEQNQELARQINKLKTIKINTIEVKLAKALDMLTELQDAVVENRIISRTIGSTIVGDNFDDWIEVEKEKMKNGQR